VTEGELDARDHGSHAATIDAAFRGGDIDIAVLAFGLLGDAEQAWVDPDHALELAEVNYTAPVHLGVLLANKMRAQSHGWIVALSSVAGERVRRSNFVYGSTKAGMDAFAQGLGDSLGDSGVRVMVVRPGFVKTKMTAGLDAAPLSTDADSVAEAIAVGLRGNAHTVWAPGPLRFVMSALRHVPRPIFKRLDL
jgi:decaprenylphospho-beta-D-erythro-pentofuranosid-2-ulose 2-reductase